MNPTECRQQDNIGPECNKSSENQASKDKHINDDDSSKMKNQTKPTIKPRTYLDDFLILVIRIIMDNHNDDDLSKMKGSPTKPRCYPGAFLILVFILANIQQSQGKECQSNDIRWRSKQTGKTVGCSPCPPCFPSEEYSIRCGTTADIGTPAKCIPCPKGKFSNGFNTKPCVSCSRCTAKIVLQKCTAFNNSKCGGCLAGYFPDPINFSCTRCSKCCHDGNDKTTKACAAVNLCKRRLHGCPTTTPNPGFTNRTIPQGTTRVHFQQTTEATHPKQRDMFISKTSANLSTSVKTFLSNPSQKATEEKDDVLSSPWIIALVVILSIVALVLFAHLIVKVYIPGKCNFRSSQQLPGDIAPTENIPLTELYDDEQSIEDFIQNNPHAVDSLCKLLCRRSNGAFDYERLSNKWQVDKENYFVIQHEKHAANGSPVRRLLELLCAERPRITVREFAESVRSINNDAYEKIISKK